MVVRDAVAHRVIGTHHVEQRGEERQGVSGREGERVEVRQGAVLTAF